MKTIMELIKKLLAGKRKFIVIAIVVVGVGMVMSQGAGGIEVQGSSVDRGPVQRYVEEVGEFTAKTEITMSGRVSGVVEEVLKVEGDKVKKGDVLILIDQKDQLLKIQGTEAEIDAIYAELAEAGRADSNKVAQVKSQIALAQNTYIKSKEDHDNNEILFASGAISKSERDDGERTYQDSLQSLRIAQNDLTLLTKGVSENTKKQFESRVLALNARLEIEKRELALMEIKAPIDGIVTDKFRKQGDVVSFGSAIIEVSDSTAFHVTSDLLVSDAGKTQVGYKVMISDPETDATWQGEITKIYPKAFSKLSDLGIEQKRVKVEIEPEAMTFDRFGYEFDLRIIFEEKEDVLRCKDSAVFQIDGAFYVFKAVEDKIMLAPVELGLQGEEYVEIISGLAIDDQIVQSPGNELEEGMKVILK